MATETPAVPVVVSDEGTPGETQPAENEGAPDLEEESPSNASSGGSPVDDAACISAGSFSYAELEEKLKRIPPGSDASMPSAKMFEVVETVFCTSRFFCHADVFVVWFVISFFLLVCLCATGEWSSRHGPTTRSIY